MINQSPELLACPSPWCDHAAFIFSTDDDMFYGKAYQGRCSQCGLNGPVKRTEAEAITAWNTRPTPDHTGIVEVNPEDIDPWKVETVARAICAAGGGNPDECVSGYSWAAGEIGRMEAGSVCHRRNWEYHRASAEAAIAALASSPSKVGKGDEVERVARILCTMRSAEGGDPPCWSALPASFTEEDCEAGCQATAKGIIASLRPSPGTEDLREALKALLAASDGLANSCLRAGHRARTKWEAARKAARQLIETPHG